MIEADGIGSMEQRRGCAEGQCIIFIATDVDSVGMIGGSFNAKPADQGEAYASASYPA